jgi:hypothetical protein
MAVRPQVDSLSSPSVRREEAIVNDVADKIERPRSLFVSGQEARAAELLGEVVDATDDPDLLRQIHELAVEDHERAGGFQKIHWRELMIDSEARLEHSVS